MTPVYRKIAATLALISAGTAQAASPRNCITSEELHGLVGYVLPVVGERVAATCKPHLSSRGYLATGLPSLLGQLQSGREDAWPAARRAFMKFADNGSKAEMKDMARLSDGALRPLVDEIFGQKLSESIKPDSCNDIEDVLEALRPMPADGAVHLVAVIINMVARKDQSMPTCPKIR